MAQSGVVRIAGIAQRLVGALVLAAVVACVALHAAPRPSASAEADAAAVVMELSTGRVLYAENAHTPMPMASTTKILTAITVLRHTDVQRVVTVCPEAEGVEGSSIYLRRGERWRILDLLYGLMLRSGNDAAVQLAVAVAGDVPHFAGLMNEVALEAGAYHSHFVNPHGLHDPRHYTTAYDLACITAYAMRDPTFRTIVGTRSYAFRHSDGQMHTFVNKNKMLQGYEGATGVKTGYTKVAGRCLVSSAERHGMGLVCVVLHEYDMWYRSAALMDAAFGAYRLDAVWLPGETRTLSIGGVPRLVTVHEGGCYPLSERERARLAYRYEFYDRPEEDGALGKVYARLDGTQVYEATMYPSA